MAKQSNTTDQRVQVAYRVPPSVRDDLAMAAFVRKTTVNELVTEILDRGAGEILASDDARAQLLGILDRHSAQSTSRAA
jgi:uncharacterized protein (DUF1778 family)